MSRMKSVLLLTNTFTEPPLPAGTMAAFATTFPGEFNVETNGCETPVGQIVKKPNGPDGTTVMLNEYACAMDGRGQGELAECMVNVRVVLPPRVGGPNPAGNVASRVSVIRQGVIPTNTSEPTGDAANVVSGERASNVSCCFAVARLSARVGCQYRGAGHGDSGTVSP